MIDNITPTSTALNTKTGFIPLPETVTPNATDNSASIHIDTNCPSRNPNNAPIKPTMAATITNIANIVPILDPNALRIAV